MWYVIIGIIVVLVAIYFVVVREVEHRMTYKIKKGKHSSSNRFIQLFHGTTMKFKFKFHRDCIYALDGEDGLDINKLYGFSEGIGTANSARIGWNCIDGRIFLYPFVHYGKLHKGAEGIAKMCEVLPDVEYIGTIRIHYGRYIFTVIDQNNMQLGEATEMRNDTTSFLKFQLFPYFGGNLPAPHTMHIDIQNL